MALGAWDSVKEIFFTEIPYLTSAVVQTISSTFFKPVKSNSHLPVLERIAQNTLKNPVDGSVRESVYHIIVIKLSNLITRPMWNTITIFYFLHYIANYLQRALEKSKMRYCIFAKMGMTLLSAGSERNLGYPGKPL